MKKYFSFSLLFFSINIVFANNELQQLIDNSKYGTTLKLDNKEYIIDFPIYLKSNIKINGNGALISPSKNWKKSNEKYSAIFNLVDVNNVEIYNLKFDNKGQDNINNIVYTSIILLGANNCKLSNIEFCNGGYLYKENTLPESPFILLLGQEKEKDFPYLTNKNSKVLEATTNNTIENCKFINNITFSAFAIRFITNWADKRNYFKNKVENNIIKNCFFEGGFEYNTIELAGGGTINNSIIGNTVKGKSVNNIDIDKGASGNLIENNNLSNLGLPNRYVNNNNVRCSPIMVHGSDEDYLAKNNRVINNIINGIKNPKIYNSRYLYSSAIGAIYVDNLLIKDNTIDNAYDKQKYGAGITLDQYVSNIKIQNNKISNSFWGIIYTPNGKFYNNIILSGNIISSSSEAIVIKRRKNGMYNKTILKNNIFLKNKKLIIDK